MEPILIGLLVTAGAGLLGKLTKVIYERKQNKKQVDDMATVLRTDLQLHDTILPLSVSTH